MTQPGTGNWLAEARSAVAPGGRVMIIAVVAAVLIIAVGSVLAWRSHNDRLERERERVLDFAAEASAELTRLFERKLAILDLVATGPGFAEGDLDLVRGAVEAAGREQVGFSGGVGWTDRDGFLKASSSLDPSSLPEDLSDQDYVGEVVLNAQPSVGHVSAVRLSGEMAAVVAVPTFSESAVSGVLLGSIALDTLHRQVPSLTPSDIDLYVVDQLGRVILANGSAEFQAPVNREHLEGPDLQVRSRGLMDDPERVLGKARVHVAGWTVVAERDRSFILARARGRLVRELSVVLLLGASVVGLAAAAAARINASHRQVLDAATRLDALESLGEVLSVAPTTRDIGDAALGVLKDVFDAESITVGRIDMEGRMRVHTVADVEWAERQISDRSVTAEESVLAGTYDSGAVMVLTADEMRARGLEPAPGVTGFVASLFIGRSARGAIGMSVRGPFPPGDDEVRLFTGMVPLLGEAFGRAAAAETERQASSALQQVLLPRDTIDPAIELQRAIRYIPAADEAEVGGDWCDLWMISPKHVGAVVGDVVGRGVVAAAAMGQLRSALRGTTAGAVPPGDALARLDEQVAQMAGSPSATVVLACFEVEGRVIAVASAGHLPPMLATREGVRVMTQVRGVPIGFLSEPTIRITVTESLMPEDTVVFYSDGLVERRGESIDEGIGRLREALSAHKDLGVEALADALLSECLEPDSGDDVALIVLRPVDSSPATFTKVFPYEELDSVVGEVADWMESNGVGEEVFNGVISRLESATEVVANSGGVDPGGALVVEVARLDRATLRVTLEYRRGRLGPETEEMYLSVLRAWGFGEMARGGPRLEFSVGGPPAD